MRGAGEGLPMKAFAWSMVALAFTAGCLGSGDDEPEPQGLDEPEPAPPGNTTAAPAWTVTTAEGTITGANAVVVSTNTPQSDTVVTFEVPEASAALGLVVTASDGGALNVLVGAPGCEANTGCEESVVADPEVTWNATEPEPGTWQLRFFLGEPGVGEVAYTVEIGLLEN